MRRRLWSRPSTKMPGRVPRRPSPEDAFKNLICDPGVRSINNMLGPADLAGRTDALNAPPGLTCAGGIFHHRRGCSGLQTFARAQARAPSLIPRHGFRPALAETWLERHPPPPPTHTTTTTLWQVFLYCKHGSHFLGLAYGHAECTNHANEGRAAHLNGKTKNCNFRWRERNRIRLRAAQRNGIPGPRSNFS